MKDGILFPLRLEPKEEKQLDITYRQKSLDRSATYIVTSARSWDRPISRAHLEVIAPKEIDVAEISYPLEPAKDTTAAGKQVFSKIIESFYPAEEFKISWTPPTGTP